MLIRFRLIINTQTGQQTMERLSQDGNWTAVQLDYFTSQPNSQGQQIEFGLTQANIGL